MGSGSYAGEVRWEIEDSTGKQWAKNKQGQAGPEESPVCLSDGVYTVKGMDTYGDGWNGFKMNIVEQENMGSLVGDWDPDGNANEYYTKTFEIKKTTPPGQRPPRTGSFTEGTGPFLAATMKFRESLSGNISSLECSTNEVYDSNKIGVNASFVHLAVRGVDERTFEFLVDGVVVCRKTMCPTCSPLIYADTWTQAVKDATLPGESASNGFGTTEAWAPKKGSTWEDTALGQVFALRFYPDTSLSDAMVSEMAQYNAKEHQLEHVCSGESCRTLYVVMRAGRRETDRGDYCDPTYPHVEGIYRIVTDPCKSGVATDARIDYATYVGNIDSYSTVMTSSAVLKSGNGYVFGGALASVNVAVGAGGGDGGYNGVKAKALKYTVSMDTPEYGASTKTAELRAQYVGESTLGDVAKFTSGFNDGRDIGNTILSMDSFNTSSGVDAIVAWTVVKGLRAVNAETGELLWDAGLAESELSDCEQEAGKRELWKGYRKTSPNGDFCGTLGEAGAMFMDELGEEARERAMKDDVYHPNYGQDHCRVKVAPASKITKTESIIVALKRQTVYILNTSGSVLSKVDISAAGNGPGYVCDKPRGKPEAECAQGEGGNGFAGDIPVVTDAAFSANDRMLFVSGYKFVQEFDQKEKCVKKNSCRFTSVAFIRAFDLSNIGSPVYAWSTWDFHRYGIFPRDFADTAALRVTVGDNGLLYAMGETRGASLSIFRFDGKSSQSLQDLFPDCSYREINATNGLTESEWVAQRRSIASSTTYWGKGERCGRYAIPTFSEGNGEPSAWPNVIGHTKRKVEHITPRLPNFCNHQGYVARIDIDTGEVLRGRFLVPRATKTGRTSAGLAASTALRLTDMKVDTDGRVYLTGRCRHAYPNMEQLSINGDPVQNGEGASLGSPTVTVLGNRLDTTYNLI
eukprot:g1726.t1